MVHAQGSIQPKLVGTLSGQKELVVELSSDLTGKVLAVESYEELALYSPGLENPVVFKKNDGQTDIKTVLSPDGRWFVTDEEYDQVTVRDVKSGQKAFHFDLKDQSVSAMAFNGDGTLLAVATDHDIKGSSIQLWNMATHQLVKSFPGKARLDFLQLSANGQVVVGGSSTADDPVAWRVADGKAIRMQNAGDYMPLYQSVVLSPDGQWIAADHFEGVVLWSVKDGRIARKFPLEDMVVKLAFSRDSLQLAAATSEGEIFKLDVNTGRELLKLKHPEVRSVLFKPDGTLITGGWDGNVLFFDQTGRVERSLSRPASYTDALMFTKDSQALLTAGPDPSFTRWENGKVVQNLATPSSRATGFNAQGDQLILFLRDKHDLKVVSTKNGDILRESEGDEFMDSFTTTYGSPLVAITKPLLLWDSQTGRDVTRSLPLDTESITSVTLDPSGEHALLSTEENQLQLWDLTQKRAVRAWPLSLPTQLQGPDLALSRHGIAAAHLGGTLILSDSASGRELHRIDVNANDDDPSDLTWFNLNDLQFSPDGKLLVTAGANGKVRLWDVATGKLLAILKDYRAAPQKVAFSQDGNTLAVGAGQAGTQSTVSLYQLR